MDMGEFGHDGAIQPGPGGWCIDAWGAGPFVIEAGGKSFRFEDSDRFGPSLVNRNGEIRANPFPGQNSPFWNAHRAWVRQGRRLAEDRCTCIYDPPKPTKYRRIGRTCVVVEYGDPEGGCVEIKPFDENR